MTTIEMTFKINREESMIALGGILAQACENTVIKKCIIYLEGELGAGKTTLVRGFLRKLGYQSSVKSPTYTIVESYIFDKNKDNNKIVYHFDLYRLTSSEELEYIGGREYFTNENAICLIEWPGQGSGAIPDADLVCSIIINNNNNNMDTDKIFSDCCRTVTIKALSNIGHKIIDNLSVYKKYHCVLSIAGSDCSGGAGIQADIKTIAANGCYAASVITAMTAQNTLGVQHICEVSPEFIGQQLHSVFSDINVDAVKIGMLHNEAVIDEVVKSLLQWQLANPANNNIVLDPVMVAKSGCQLIAESAIDYLKRYLFPLVNLITPNLQEAEILSAMPIITLADMQNAAVQLGKAFKLNVVVKGGHLPSLVEALEESLEEEPKKEQHVAADVLYLYEQDQCYWFKAAKIYTNNTHGTGCTLSSAIASYLAQGCNLVEAIYKAKQYLTSAIAAGSVYKLGQGHGPVCHIYKTLGNFKTNSVYSSSLERQVISPL